MGRIGFLLPGASGAALVLGASAVLAQPDVRVATGSEAWAKVEIYPVDRGGARIDVGTSHASLSRTLPSPLLPETTDGDTDALRWIVVAAAEDLPSRLDFLATAPGGDVVDRLDAVLLHRTPCPPDVPADRVCAVSPPIRATADLVDRSHPAVRGRSLQARIGGRITVEMGGVAVASIPVGGPRHSAVGPMEGYRARLRVHLVRIEPGGDVPIGEDEAGAIEAAQREVDAASAIWGQCGMRFGENAQIDIVDPPPPYLLAVGCNLALPASGGEIAFRLGPRALRVPTRPRDAPIEVAHRVAEAVRTAGFRAEVSPNARSGSGPLGSVDVLVRDRNGTLATISRDGVAPLSSDDSLGVCLGELNLADGLTHFTDFTAATGTIEERTLVKALDDGDPATIEVIVIPSFARSSRIGESFISADGSSIRNVVIIDRSGVQARSRSYTLAHELGHVFLDMPGHPDDYGVDRPDLLMDSDAADASIFGPRRLRLGDCECALLQSGPGAPVPLLEPMPLTRER